MRKWSLESLRGVLRVLVAWKRWRLVRAAEQCANGKISKLTLESPRQRFCCFILHGALVVDGAPTWPALRADSSCLLWYVSLPNALL